jgi:arsenate reductase
VSQAPYRVLFVCRENSCQSQMAEAWLRALGGAGVVARSAGTAPRHLHPLATAAMQEAGVDIAAQRGKGIDAVKHERFDLVVTLCDTAAEELPALPGSPATRHDPLDDPTWIEDEHGPVLDEFRRVRDTARDLVEGLLAAR